MSIPTPALEIQKLEKKLGGAPVLCGVSLRLPEGGCTALLGPSGCGKTTLLRIVAGLETADAGRIEVGGSVTDDPRPRVAPERRGVGLVFQDLALWPHMTVRGNLEFVIAARKGGSTASVGDQIHDALRAVGLPRDLLGRHPGELSGGERQRAALARAIVQEPVLLLLDEPLSGLDRHLRTHLIATLRQLRAKRSLSMLLVTHDREEAFALADRVALIKDGQIVQEGTPDDVYARPNSRFVAGFVGVANFLMVRRHGDMAATDLGQWQLKGPLAKTDGPVLAVVRPEAVRVVPLGGQPARVADVYYLGDHWNVELEIRADTRGRGAQRVLMRSHEPLEIGKTLRIDIERPAFVSAAIPSAAAASSSSAKGGAR